jgi:hypothetical protein
MEARAAGISVSDVIETLACHFARTHKVVGHWNLAVEKPSLGGLLLLRQELEQFAELAGVSRIELTFTGAGATFDVPALARMAFTSRYQVNFTSDEAPGQSWPPATAMTSPHFSYQFFDRIGVLASALGHPPALQWAPDTLEAAAAIRRLCAGKLVALHMKNVPGQTEADSNAVFRYWKEFLAARAASGPIEFLALGGDAIPDEILGIAGVRSAQREAIPLQVQLALVSLSDGFIGMASGVCAAAVLSDVPYVLFKHPSHHVGEMERELGIGDRFPFARPRQLVWRTQHATAMLERALSVVRAEKS